MNTEPKHYSMDKERTQRDEAAQQGSRTADAARSAFFTNREISWLAFNRRVLREAGNRDNPLLERVRFLSITASNLDEFFMVRFASLCRKAARNLPLLPDDMSGLSAKELKAIVLDDARAFMSEQAEMLQAEIVPALSAAGIFFHMEETLNAGQMAFAKTVFDETIRPALAPVIWDDRSIPFPFHAGRQLHLGLLLDDEAQGRKLMASIPLPPGIPRAVRFPAEHGGGFICVEQIMMLFVRELLPKRKVLGCWVYRITRDEDYVVTDNADMRTLVEETQQSLRKRKTGAAIRLEVEANAPNAFVERLAKALRIAKRQVFRLGGPLDLTFLAKVLCRLEGMEAHCYQPFRSVMPEALQSGRSIFEVLSAGDVFLHHPYDSFDAVLRFIRESALDPRVLAINITLYRVSGNSPVIRALCEAAEAGKRVTALLELKARFDEENNLHWAEVLRKSGCDVIFGMPRLKTHSKITLVVRREGGSLKRYMHLGTGNYNDVTAKLYTDMGLLTCNAELGEDAQAFFNMITGFSREPSMKRLVYAPKTLRTALYDLIEREIIAAKQGRPSGIVAKMNSLADPGIIAKLCEASAARVPVRLIVRGVCCLRAGVEGLSETIEVHSIVGRFLEHSRVFCFENEGDPKIYLSSADWMPRNLNRRVELMFPILDPAVKEEIVRVLEMQWKDNAKSCRMLPDGRYVRIPAEGERINAQEAMIR